MKKQSIKKHFYTAASPECSHENNIFKPALAFEVKSQLSDIAGIYVFPDNHTAAAYEEYLCSYIATRDEATMERMRADWAVLVELNPELKAVDVRLTDWRELVDALRGVSCLFNIDDINFFITVPRITGSYRIYADTLETMPGRAKDYADIEARTGHRPAWVASPKTLEKIKKQLDQRANDNKKRPSGPKA